MPVFVWCRFSIAIMSPWSVRLKFIVSVGVKVCCIGPAVVLAFTVNNGITSTKYVVVLVPVSESIFVFIESSPVLEIGWSVIWICFWFVVVGSVSAVWYRHAGAWRVCVRL